MKIIGIIAEYNPFHNGHAYQIEEIRKRTGADYIVAAMSGDFVQRGAPAVIDKFSRTKTALSCGADLVIELPVLWATSSAEYFAMAGVTLFEKMGCVEGICFGGEADDISLLSAIADILTDEPEPYRHSLSSYLKKGESFPSARTKAVCDYLSVTQAAMPSASMDISACADAPGGRCHPQQIQTTAVLSLLNMPNNILAVEYLKALKRRHSSVRPYLIQRKGAGYHDKTLDIPNASASAIRRALRQTCSMENIPWNMFDSLQAAMPKSAWEILDGYLCQNPPLWRDDFSGILGYLLLSSTPEALAAAGDCNTDIANRLFRNRHHLHTFEEFCEQNKSKEITYTRLSRILFHLILGISSDSYALGKKLDYIPYLRLLGFRKDAAPLLSRLKETADVPVIAKLADAPRILSEDAYTLLKKDIFAGELYRQVRCDASHRIYPGYHSGSVSDSLRTDCPPLGSEFSQAILLL